MNDDNARLNKFGSLCELFLIEPLEEVIRGNLTLRRRPFVRLWHVPGPPPRRHSFGPAKPFLVPFYCVIKVISLHRILS